LAPEIGHAAIGCFAAGSAASGHEIAPRQRAVGANIVHNVPARGAVVEIVYGKNSFVRVAPVVAYLKNM
jgi:hypothetical protein